MKKVVFDLKFWRRFIKGSPKAGFEYILGRLPVNDARLASDASSIYGMAGAIIFGRENKDYLGLAGLFWQITWVEWTNMAAMPDLIPGSVKINIAEFIAALITCETFADFCVGRITTLELDNFAAKV